MQVTILDSLFKGNTAVNANIVLGSAVIAHNTVFKENNSSAGMLFFCVVPS